MRPIRLYVNIDHVATVRQARRTDEPDPFEAAALCEAAGADGITVHLREDRRHIQDRDVERLAPSVRSSTSSWPRVAEIVDLACRLRPHQATIVPERREEVTTEGGLDLRRPNAAAAGNDPSPRRGRNSREPVHRSGLSPRSTRPRISASRQSSSTPAAMPIRGERATPRSTSCKKLRATPQAWVWRCTPVMGSHISTWAGRGNPGDRGAEHRAQHREPGGDGRDAASGSGDATVGEPSGVLIPCQHE